MLVRKMLKAREIYDAIKEEGRILSHLMQILASSYFFALLHFYN